MEAEIKENEVIVKGARGELSQAIPREISVEKEENKMIVKLAKKTKQGPALWGLIRSLLSNNVKGVTEGFEKQLEIRGVGYHAFLPGEGILRLEVGFSHPVEFHIPDGVAVAVKKNTVAVSGINKQQVGEFAAKIRNVRPPEPYKGKGIRYAGEIVKMKQAKKTTSAR